jgi:hypothetical protein
VPHADATSGRVAKPTSAVSRHNVKLICKIRAPSRSYQCCKLTGIDIFLKCKFSRGLHLFVCVCTNQGSNSRKPASSAEAGHAFAAREEAAVEMSGIIERLATPLLLRERPAWEVRAGHIARLDRRWFRAHPERRHRCRWPDAVELDLCDSDRRARLVMAIRHLGRGHIVYQPVIFHGDLPRDERSAAALFALAATSSEPITVVAQMDLLRLRRELPRLPRRSWCMRISIGDRSVGHRAEKFRLLAMVEVANDPLEAGENGA